MITIVDYQAGNILNVERAFNFLGKETIITSDLETISKASLLVLPGVGAFGSTMHSLKIKKLDIAIQEHIHKGKPFLGICLGLQLLFDSSEENPSIKGLNILPGKIKKFPYSKNLPVPQIGWNSVDFFNSYFKDFSNDFFYFVHSFYLDNFDSSITLGKTEYGLEYTSAIIKDNIVAFQFHPEKSGAKGLSLLKKTLTYFRIES